MKTILFILLIIPSLIIAQNRKSVAENCINWECIDYGRDIARVYSEDAVKEAKAYFINKFVEFQLHCKRDSVLVIVPGTGKINNKPLMWYQYVKPEPTFEYFIEWLLKHQ